MRPRHLFLFFLLLLTATLFSACSGDKDDDTENATEKMTREVAEKAVRQIQDPMDKASEASRATEEHNQRVKESAN